MPVEGTTGVSENHQSVPSAFSLEQNYPNPFNPSTTIRYSLPQTGRVTLKVFDLLGKEVAALVNGVVSAGNHEVRFDASKLSGGVYFYKITTENNVSTKKMILIK